MEFIFMLTNNDRTVVNAMEVLESVKSSGLHHVGFKDVGSTPQSMRELVDCAHGVGMEVMLEVVSTSAESELTSVRAAVEAGFDWVLGGTNAPLALPILAGTTIKYCPFPGRVVGHPSRLEGSVKDIAQHTTELTSMPGVHGVDVLTYRHADADHFELTKAVVDACPGPVIVAGSIVTEKQIRTQHDAGAWGFTIGSAIFEHQIPGGPTIADQVRWVLDVSASMS
jgi:hypothetical protein